MTLCGLFRMFGSLLSVMLSGDGSLKFGGVVLGVCKTESALDQNTPFASICICSLWTMADYCGVALFK